MATVTARILGAMTAAVLMVGASLTVAAPASADVLVNSPAQRVCRGHTFKVGVWYQAHSGGPRSYRVNVYRPNGRRVFHAHGKASARGWKLWRIRAKRVGTYKTVYRGRSSNGPWKATMRTRSRRC